MKTTNKAMAKRIAMNVPMLRARVQMTGECITAKELAEKEGWTVRRAASVLKFGESVGQFWFDYTTMAYRAA